jgi:hypothetical protein
MHPGVSHDWLAGRRIMDPSGKSSAAQSGTSADEVVPAG